MGEGKNEPPSGGKEEIIEGRKFKPENHELGLIQKT